MISPHRTIQINHMPQLGNLVKQLVKLKVPAVMLLHLPTILINHRPQLSNLLKQLVKLQVPAGMLLHLPSIVSLAAVLRLCMETIHTLTLQLVVKLGLELEIEIRRKSLKRSRTTLSTSLFQLSASLIT